MPEKRLGWAPVSVSLPKPWTYLFMQNWQCSRHPDPLSANELLLIPLFAWQLQLPRVQLVDKQQRPRIPSDLKIRVDFL